MTGAVFYHPGITCSACGLVFPCAFDEDAVLTDCPNPTCTREVTIPAEFLHFPDGRCMRCHHPIDGFLHTWDGHQYVCLKR